MDSDDWVKKIKRERRERQRPAFSLSPGNTVVREAGVQVCTAKYCREWGVWEGERGTKGKSGKKKEWRRESRRRGLESHEGFLESSLNSNQCTQMRKNTHG